MNPSYNLAFIRKHRNNPLFKHLVEQAEQQLIMCAEIERLSKQRLYYNNDNHLNT